MLSFFPLVPIDRALRPILSNQNGLFLLLFFQSTLNFSNSFKFQFCCFIFMQQLFYFLESKTGLLFYPSPRLLRWRYGTVFIFFFSSLRVFINFFFYLCVLRKLRCWSVSFYFLWMLSRFQLFFFRCRLLFEGHLFPCPNPRLLEYFFPAGPKCC